MRVVIDTNVLVSGVFFGVSGWQGVDVITPSVSVFGLREMRANLEITDCDLKWDV